MGTNDWLVNACKEGISPEEGGHHDLMYSFLMYPTIHLARAPRYSALCCTDPLHCCSIPISHADENTLFSNSIFFTASTALELNSLLLNSARCS